MPPSKQINPSFLLKDAPYSTSDHMPIIGEAKIAEHSAIKIASWNLMMQCKSRDGTITTENPNGIHNLNNPYYIFERPQDYQKRLGIQFNYIRNELIKRQQIDFILLQEAELFGDINNPHSVRLKNDLIKNLPEGYGLQILRPDRSDKTSSDKDLVIIYNKKHQVKNFEKSIKEDKQNQDGSTTPRHHQLTGVFAIDGNNNNQVAIGNFHLNYNATAAQIAEQKQIAQRYNQQGIAFIAAGDANSPTEISGLYGIKGATSHDSITKETKDKSTTAVNNRLEQGTIHGATVEERRNNYQKNYDSFAVYAGNKDIDFSILSGKKVEVDNSQDNTCVLYQDYRPIRFQTIKAQVLTPSTTPDPKEIVKLKSLEYTKNQLVAILKAQPADQEISKLFNQAIESQQELLKPTKTYKGLGIKSKITRMPNGEAAILIEEIFSKELIRFYQDGNALSQEGLKLLEGGFVTHIGSTEIEERVKHHGGDIANANFHKELVSFLHKNENTIIELTIQKDGKEYKINCHKNSNSVFVTQDCAEAKLKDVGGCGFNPQQHSLQCLNNYEQMLKEAQQKAQIT